MFNSTILINIFIDLATLYHKTHAVLYTFKNITFSTFVSRLILTFHVAIGIFIIPNVNVESLTSSLKCMTFGSDLLKAVAISTIKEI